jgi:hypothetical protein
MACFGSNDNRLGTPVKTQPLSGLCRKEAEGHFFIFSPLYARSGERGRRA